MAKKVVSYDDAKWRAENDARTMAEYEEIMSDSRRRNAAVKAAKGMAKDLTARASAMSRVTQTGKK